MKPDPDFDPDFTAPSPRRYPLVRTCGLLLLLALVAGLTLFSLRAARAPQAIAHGAVPVLTANGLTIQQATPDAPIKLTQPQPVEHFVVMASPSVDPQMVHRAPAGIDEAMVIRPHDRQSAPAALVAPQGTVPGNPGYLPVPPDGTVPDQQVAPQLLPYPPVPAEPR